MNDHDKRLRFRQMLAAPGGTGTSASAPHSHFASEKARP
jgi:hypothetical protein